MHIIELIEVNLDYEKKLKEEKQGKEMLGLAWDVQELNSLNENGRQIIIQCKTMQDKLLNLEYDKIADNFASLMDRLRQSTVSFVKRVTKYQRVAATHILVVMISPEERKTKPYALTVQCIAYKSIKDSKIRQICNELVKEMKKKGMKVAG